MTRRRNFISYISPSFVGYLLSKISLVPQKIKKNYEKTKKTTKDKTEKKRELNANFGSDLSSPVTFGVRVRLFPREGGEAFIQ